METLDGTEWDVVIAGTGLPQSLLALSLSRSGKRILHVDEKEYYGGEEAALSLSEAEEWAERHSANHDALIYRAATVTKPAGEGKLSSSRAYSLALAPHLIYSRSRMLDAISSSRLYNQLEFHAVGSWFVLDTNSVSQATVVRVPSGREDVFQDTSLDLRAKRSLMKFLRFVGNYEEHAETWEDKKETPFPSFLQNVFGLPPASHGPIMALTMSESAPEATSTGLALPRIARHLRGIGVYGPGFGAVLPKWGGLAEITQAACRACAVGGGVYVLGTGVKGVRKTSSDEGKLVELSNGDPVSTTWLVGTNLDLPIAASGLPSDQFASMTTVSKSISFISSPLSSLFPPTSEGGVTPAGAVIVVPSNHEDDPPVHIFAHTADAGECPINQCVLYASVTLPLDQGHTRLDQAVKALLDSTGDQPKAEILWQMQYEHRLSHSSSIHIDSNTGIVVLPALSEHLVLEDSVIDNVKTAWQTITGEDEDVFMKFDAREGAEDED